MGIKFPFNYKLFRYLRWDYYFFFHRCHEYICSVYASQNTLWKFGFHLCIFSTGCERCFMFFHFSNVECLNSRRQLKKLCQSQRYRKMCWNSLLKNASIKLGEFFSLKAGEFFQNILFKFFWCQIFAKFTAK